MKYFCRFMLFFVPFLAFLAAGCSGPPTSDIERAQKAMDQAKAQAAEMFASEEWNAAETAWKEAQERIDAKQYSQAISKLLKAQQAYQKARDVAQGRKEAAITQIKGDQKATELRCNTLKENVAAAKKLAAARKKELEDICKGVDEKVAKITSMLDQGEYNEAKTLASNTLREVYEAEVKLKGYLGAK
jgi:hypothetical protein